MNVLLAVIALYLTAILIPLFGYYYYWNPWGLGDPEMVLTEAQTMVFITLVLAELVNAFNCRSDYLSLFKVGVFEQPLSDPVRAGLPGDDGGGDRMGAAVPSVPHHAAALAGLGGGRRPQPHPDPGGGTDQVDGPPEGPIPAAGGPGPRVRFGLKAATVPAEG